MSTLGLLRCPALFDVVDVKQHYGNEEPEEFLPTFKDYAAKDIPDVFFCEDEHAEIHNIDGKDVLVVLREATLKEHNSHWEAGAPGGAPHSCGTGGCLPL